MAIRTKAACVIIVGVLFSNCLTAAGAEQQLTDKERKNIATNETRHFGDAPDNPGPLATDLSYSTRPKAVAKAMRKVADWQLERSQPYFDRIWTWSVLYAGFLAASDTLHDEKYREAMIEMGKKFDWQLRSQLPNADDQSIGQAYLELYLLKKDSAMMKPTQERLDAVLAAPRDSRTPGKEIPWWWCDALFMAPPVWARMYAATEDRKYITYLDEEWSRTSNLLYDKQEHLYARDVTYLDKTEANGKKMFWSRGNGWVMGGLVRTLQYLPKDDPARQKYIEQLKEMAARLAAIQSPDGMWRAGLLDADAYPLPEISGTALIAFGMAAGINNGWLDKKTYKPVIEKAWVGMLHHIYADGRLGCIQQTGADPEPFKASSSYTYGVGGFLLAGSEIYKMH